MRECFPSRVLLGSLSAPLKPLPDCQARDLTEDQSGSVMACLCSTDFCNDDQPSLQQPQLSNREVARSQSRQSQPARPLCPPGWELVGGDCYFLSSDKLGWIGARKQCERRGARLLSLDLEEKRKSLGDHLTRASR